MGSGKKEVKDHKPVLLSEVIELLKFNRAHLNNQVRIIDATLGTAGHAIEFIKRGYSVLGIDADKEILEIARKKLLEIPSSDLIHAIGSFVLVNANFRDLKTVAKKNGFTQVDGILIDLGVNIKHYHSGRGFSYKSLNETLDMRLSPETSSVTAANLLNILRKDQIISLLNPYLGLYKAKQIAAIIEDRRRKKNFSTVGDLTEALGITGPDKRSDLATKVFMALRIAVNSELDNLKAVLPQALSLLRVGGRLIVISFHSGEDEIVKDYFKIIQNDGIVRILTRSPIVATRLEIEDNPRARSAKLRCLEKLKNTGNM